MRTNPELAVRFIEALSAENIEKQRRHEYHQGHPTLTELDIDDGSDHEGRPPDAQPGDGKESPGRSTCWNGDSASRACAAHRGETENAVADRDGNRGRFQPPRAPKEGEAPAPPIAAPGYRVFVDDTFHYMDEDERYELGVFGTFDEAVAARKQIVDRCLDSMLKPDTTAAGLYEQYVTFGEDPYVDPADARVSFSAWDYAKARCQVLARPDPTSI